jgi:hypothetical protein
LIAKLCSDKGKFTHAPSILPRSNHILEYAAEVPAIKFTNRETQTDERVTTQSFAEAERCSSVENA